MNKRLHILFLSSWYPSRVLPTNGDFIQRHAEAVALKHKVTSIHVISDPKIAKNIEIIDKKINEIRTLIAYVKSTNNPILKIIIHFIAYLKILKKIKSFDIVHLNVIYPAGIIALYLKWFKHKPFIISEHCTKYYEPYCYNFKLIPKKITQLIAKNAIVICPVTNNLGNAMKKFGLNNNYIKVPNVVDTKLFVPSKKNSKTYSIIHISSMNLFQKNVPQILKVINQLQLTNINFKFYLIGGNANEFRSFSYKLGIKPNNIVFKNQMTQTKLATYIQKSDVLVLFSEIESSSCVLLEALSCGVKVITTNVGGASENLPEKYGYLINKNDHKALLNTLIAFEKNKNKISKKEMHNYIKQNFSQKAIAKQFTKVYLSVLNN